MRQPSRWAIILAMAVGSGCTGTTEEEGPDFSNLVPVTGVITLNSEPLPGAVVTFLPKQWATGLGETNEKGEYSLSTANRPGLSPGDYKVAISLLLSAEGEPQGLGARSSLAQPPSMLTAKEYLPRHYADLGTSKLTAHIEAKGGTFNFNLDAPELAKPPRPESGTNEKGEPAAAKAGDDSPVTPASPANAEPK
ncbi:carboxypeptidase-like regulatory domain-containing protein [Singulisphaera sp. GP187]|uniref:carboxypeptidase-like regulatory domain-containing protein n=1 Tax=Singulisphaera sp. GP187 TaxID=1882752 RepID=UPI001C1FAD96|nr:carboxypeptidase-like regulatory domain-containing protein [Singulisphaera sp. GP187]